MKKIVSLMVTFVLMLGVFTMPASAAVDVSGLTGDDDCLEILLVGCSYGRDTMQDASYMLKGLGINYILGRLFMGSTSIKTHYEKAVADESLYSTYHEANPTIPGVEYNQNLISGVTKLSQALQRRDWDIIILQTTTGVVAQPETYVNEDGESYAKLLGDLVLKSDPQAKLGWNMVWANPETVIEGNSVSSIVKNTFEGNSTRMWDGITESVKAHVMPYVKGEGASEDAIFDYIIPSGTVIQNAEGLGLTEAQLYRDNCHLSTSHACFGVGLAATSAMIGITPEEAAAAYSTKTSVADTKETLIKAAELALESPFISVPSAKKIIEDTVFNLRPSELEGKDEAAAKTYLTEKINDLIKYTNIQMEESDLTINDYKADSSFTISVVLDDEFSVENKEIVVSDGFIITPSVASGSKISAVSELQFKFDMDINPKTLTTDTVLLKEKIKNAAEGAATHNERLYKSAYDEDSRTFTITFNEGDIAPGGEYTVEFTTGVYSVDDINMENPKEFTYTVRYDDYYINDNFSRFKKGTALAFGTGNTTLLPYQYANQTRAGDGQKAAQIIEIEENSEKVKVMYAKARHSTYGSGYMWGYRPDYLPESRAFFTEHEIEFKFQGTGKDLYSIWSNYLIIAKADDGDYYLHYATNAPITTPNSLPSGLVKLVKVEPGVKTKLKIIMYRNLTTSGRDRTIYKIYLNGTEVDVSKYNESVTLPKKISSYNNYFLDYSTSGNTYNSYMFCVGTYGGTTKVDENTSYVETAELYIYNVKYAPYKQVECTPENAAENVSVDADVVLKFDFPMNESSLSGITVTDDGNVVIDDTTRVYDSDTKTYTISFNKTPVYKAYYRVDVPDSTVKTSSGHFVDPVSFQFQFEPRVLKWAEASGGGIADKTLTKNVDITNADSGKVMLAAYWGGKLIGVDIVDITEPSNTSQPKTLTVTADEIADTTKKISYKIMYFSDFGKIKPLISAIEGEAR